MKVLLFISILFFSVESNKNVVGDYSSIKAGFEWGSILTIKENSTFFYSYASGGCRAEITGQWKVNGKILEFIYDEEFSKEYLAMQDSIFQIEWDSLSNELDIDLGSRIGSPCYPDLNKGVWKLTKRGLRQKYDMYCSCWNSKGLHRKL